MIVVVNTTLTTLGLIALKIPGVWFMSTLVFVCSFVPVVGVLISTTPMLIVALMECGVGKALSVIAMVLGVHFVEAYVLNPQIYSSHLDLHPLVVLVVLYVAEHSFGVSGLLFAVPIAVFLMRLVQAPSPATAELANPNANLTPRLMVDGSDGSDDVAH